MHGEHGWPSNVKQTTILGYSGKKDCEESIMVKKNVNLSDNIDLTPDFIAELVQTACKYDSNSYVIAGNKKINLKSIMGVMSLVTVKDRSLTLTTEGGDEGTAMDAIEGFIGRACA